jgi:hypothetical protein
MIFCDVIVPTRASTQIIPRRRFRGPIGHRVRGVRCDGDRGTCYL